ncbi:MAG: hypothetical protein ACRCSY_03600 [Cetobacterium sp.]
MKINLVLFAPKVFDALMKSASLYFKTNILAVAAGQIQLVNIKAPAIVPIDNPPPENARVITKIQTIVGTPEIISTTLIINVSIGLPALNPAIAPYIDPIIVETNETNSAMNKEFEVLIHNMFIQSLPCGPVPKNG